MATKPTLPTSIPPEKRRAIGKSAIITVDTSSGLRKVRVRMATGDPRGPEVELTEENRLRLKTCQAMLQLTVVGEGDNFTVARSGRNDSSTLGADYVECGRLFEPIGPTGHRREFCSPWCAERHRRFRQRHVLYEAATTKRDVLLGFASGLPFVAIDEDRWKRMIANPRNADLNRLGIRLYRRKPITRKEQELLLRDPVFQARLAAVQHEAKELLAHFTPEYDDED